MTTTSVPARRNGRPAARRGDLHRTVISLSAGSADDAEPGRDAGADPLLTALAGFAGRAPDGLDDRVFTRWATAPSRVGDVRVAFTADGAQFVRPTEGTDDDRCV